MKKILLLGLIVINFQFAFAQRDEKRNSNQNNQYAPYTVPGNGSGASKFFIGGSLGLSLGSYTSINISPLAGYRFSDFFAAGIDLNYDFVSDKTYPGQTQSYTILGAGIFARIYPINHVFLQAEPEYNHYTIKYKNGSETVGEETHNVRSLLLGGGYVQQASDNVSFTIGIFYDVLQDKYSPYYGQPVFRGGINVGL